MHFFGVNIGCVFTRTILTTIGDKDKRIHTTSLSPPFNVGVFFPLMESVKCKKAQFRVRCLTRLSLIVNKARKVWKYSENTFCCFKIGKNAS